jgi:hypothetical protein
MYPGEWLLQSMAGDAERRIGRSSLTPYLGCRPLCVHILARPAEPESAHNFFHVPRVRRF